MIGYEAVTELNNTSYKLLSSGKQANICVRVINVVNGEREERVRKREEGARERHMNACRYIDTISRNTLVHMVLKCVSVHIA